MDSNQGALCVQIWLPVMFLTSVLLSHIVIFFAGIATLIGLGIVLDTESRLEPSTQHRMSSLFPFPDSGARHSVRAAHSELLLQTVG